MTASIHPEFNAPLYLAWEVTLRRNARCLHCYSESGPGVHHYHDLTTDEAFRAIDQLAEAVLLILAFFGGEPLLRRDIFQLIERAVGKLYGLLRLESDKRWRHCSAGQSTTLGETHHGSS